jgi:acyl-CoA reductase-like NAD-dependent aldehyde dehydrogenase
MKFDTEFTATIDGRPVASAATLDVLNPATEAVIAQAPDLDRQQLDVAVAAARRAFPGWRDTPPEQRRALVAALGARVNAHTEQLAKLLTLEQGKPLAAAQMEIAGSAYWLHAVSQQELPVLVNEDTAERYSETQHVPIGVVGAIVPWNFPVLLAVWKVAAALVTGNTVVLKPSPFTPLTSLKLGELAREVLPPGVLNVVSGGDRLGPWMTEHPGIDKISFTGSTGTGRKVMEGASRNLKRVTLELGGNDPAIVFPDVDVEQVAPQLFWAAFLNSGQLCVAAKRMYIHEDVYDRMSKALIDYAATVKVGDGSQPGVQLGPLQNERQYERVLRLIAAARAADVRFLTGNDPLQRPGYFVPVMLVDNPPDDSNVVVEEAFGPVLPLLKFRDIDEVVRRANATDYGLAASVWSKDLGIARQVAARLECGTVWINEIHYTAPNAAFAGHKQSGIGVENGTAGLLEYTIPQTVILRKNANGIVAQSAA